MSLFSLSAITFQHVTFLPKELCEEQCKVLCNELDKEQCKEQCNVGKENNNVE